jgi:hypothetical protein
VYDRCMTCILNVCGLQFHYTILHPFDCGNDGEPVCGLAPLSSPLRSGEVGSTKLFCSMRKATAALLQLIWGVAGGPGDEIE